MLFHTVPRELEECRWRVETAEGPVVAHVDPGSPGGRLALGEHQHPRVVGMYAGAGQYVGADSLDEGTQHGRATTDLIGQGRQADRHALAGVALGLPVQGLVLPVLLEQHARQQVRTGKAAGQNPEGRRCLGDRLAVPAGELLPDVLHDLPRAWHHLQRLSDILVELR